MIPQSKIELKIIVDISYQYLIKTQQNITYLILLLINTNLYSITQSFAFNIRNPQKIEFLIRKGASFNLIQQMQGKEKGGLQSVKEQHICSICLQLAKCKHIFCQSCLIEGALIAENNRCPLCRTNFTPNEYKLQSGLWDRIQKQYPLSVQQRKKNIKERNFARFLVGNTTEVIQTNQDNKYRWTLFVKPAPGDKRLSETIKKIDVKLHPTFNPSTVTFNIVDNKIVELSRLGWGTFRIEISIYWKDLFNERVSQIYHDLQFVGVKERIVHTMLTLK